MFELDQFTFEVDGKPTKFGFDFYQNNASCKFKAAADFLPEYDIDYQYMLDLSNIDEIYQVNPKKTEDHTEGPEFVFDKVEINLKMIRDPSPKIVKFFIPTLILSFFMISTFSMTTYADRSSNTSVILLSFISLIY